MLTFLDKLFSGLYIYHYKNGNYKYKEYGNDENLIGFRVTLAVSLILFLNLLLLISFIKRFMGLPPGAEKLISVGVFLISVTLSFIRYYYSNSYIVFYSKYKKAIPIAKKWLYLSAALSLGALIALVLLTAVYHGPLINGKIWIATVPLIYLGFIVLIANIDKTQANNMTKESPQTYVFYPSTAPSAKKMWINMLKLDALFTILAGIHYLIRPEWPYHLLALLISFCVSLLVILLRKEVLEIRISVSDKTLSATSLTAFGKTIETEIYLPTAYYKYKPEIDSWPVSWRMHIYNNYFKSRLSVYHGGDYTKEELDAIDVVIKQIRGK